MISDKPKQDGALDIFPENEVIRIQLGHFYHDLKTT